MRTVTEQPTTLQEETITVSRAHYAALQEENVQLNQKVNWLMEQMRLARHKRFGSSSEKSQYDTLDLFNEAEITADPKLPEPALTTVQTHYRKKSKESQDRLPADLPVEVIEHRLPSRTGKITGIFYPPFLHIRPISGK